MKTSLTCFLLLMLLCCKSKTADNFEDAFLDSLMNQRPIFFVSVDADVVGYTAGRYSMILRAEVSGEKANPNDVKLFANNVQMEYSTAVGNYYERTSAYRLTLDEDNKLSDSVIFSLRYRDSTTYNILAADIRPIMTFINNRALYRELQVDRTKSILIDWGGNEPDSITVCQMYTITKGNAITIDTDCIYEQKWNAASPLEISTRHYTREDAVVATFYVKWFKSHRYTTVENNIGGSISIHAVAEQELVVDKSALM